MDKLKPCYFEPERNNHEYLYFGDNLNILREHLITESVDLIYLDPPFNSNANYNVLFKSPKVTIATRRLKPSDTWHWGEQAEHEMADILLQSNANVTELLGNAQTSRQQ
ncbi:hypothetical protein [Chromatium okenii]|uniref:hypothetical protein n=1 Tax=Chromatium okenii TaxID=61644 RepID=UPI0018D5372E|nr:hypothetical protein [Chromatium okenii]